VAAIAPTSTVIVGAPGEGAPTGGVVHISTASIVDAIVLKWELALAGSTRRLAITGVHPIVFLILFAWLDVDRTPPPRRVCSGRCWLVIGKVLVDKRKDTVSSS